MKTKTLVSLAVALVAGLSACTTPTHGSPHIPMGFEEGKPFSDNIKFGTATSSDLHVTEGKVSAHIRFTSPAPVAPETGVYRQAQQNFASAFSVSGKTKIELDVHSSKATNIDVVVMVTDKSKSDGSWVWKSKNVAVVAGDNKLSVNFADITTDGKDTGVAVKPDAEDIRSFVIGSWVPTANTLDLYVDNVRFN